MHQNKIQLPREHYSAAVARAQWHSLGSRSKAVLDFNFHPRSQSVCIVNYAREAPHASEIIWHRTAAWIRPWPKSRARDLPAECTCAIAARRLRGGNRCIQCTRWWIERTAAAKRWAPSVICNCDPFLHPVVATPIVGYAAHTAGLLSQNMQIIIDNGQSGSICGVIIQSQSRALR